MFCFCEASHWWLPLLETELQREKLSMEVMAREDSSRVNHQQTSPAHHSWLVCRKEQLVCANHHPLALHVCSSMDWKKKLRFPGWDRITGATWRRVESDVEQTERLLLARQIQEERQQLAWFVLNIRGNEIIIGFRGRRNPTNHEDMGCAVL